RNLVICLGFALVLASCGNSKNDGDAQPTLQGVAIPGSQWHGLAFTAVNVQRDFLDSRLYYYEFATGKVRQLSSGESGHALVFWADDRLLHFNSRKETKDFRAFDPRDESTQVPAATPLASLTAAHPSHAFSLGHRI